MINSRSDNVCVGYNQGMHHIYVYELTSTLSSILIHLFQTTFTNVDRTLFSPRGHTRI